MNRLLKHVSHATDSVKTVKVVSHDLFQRVASSIEQIAGLNHYRLAVTISDGDIPAEAADDDANAASSTGSEGNETVARRSSEGLSYEQIKDALKANGVEFAANARKSELAALLDAVAVAPTGDADADQTGSANGQQATGA